MYFTRKTTVFSLEIFDQNRTEQWTRTDIKVSKMYLEERQLSSQSRDNIAQIILRCYNGSVVRVTEYRSKGLWFDSQA